MRSLSQTARWATYGTVAILCFVLVALLWQRTWAAPLHWHMVNVNYSPSQADAHLLVTGMGERIMIDVGDARTASEALVPYLKERQINSLDRVFISHPHKDHYGGLESLLDERIAIKEVYFNVPPRDVCDGEIPWGCDYPHILAVQKRLADSGTKVLSAAQGMEFALGFRSSLKILFAFTPATSPVGAIDINDMSLIMRLDHGVNSVSFTGDLNALIGGYLAGKRKDVRATMLKVPHHGTEGVAPDSFFEATEPQVSLVPAPLLLWCSPRSQRIRDWHRVHSVPTYVSGAHGHVVIKLRQSTFNVFAENGQIGTNAQKICPETFQ